MSQKLMSQNTARRTAVPAAVLTASALALTACGDGGAETGGEGDTTIRVATHLPTMYDLLEVAGEVAEDQGFEVDIVQVNDNVQYNRILADGEVDANFAQHRPFMEAYNAENDADLEAVTPIYDARVGFYSREYDQVDEIPEGSRVAIPNDHSNEGRALAILEAEGLITLSEDAGYEARISDVEENPLDLDFFQIDLLNLASAYEEEDVALVFNYPNYMIDTTGLTPDDALFLEEPEDLHFAISLVAREDNADSEQIQVLEEAMTSQEVQEFLEDEYGESLFPAF